MNSEFRNVSFGLADESASKDQRCKSNHIDLTQLSFGSSSCYVRAAIWQSSSIPP